MSDFIPHRFVTGTNLDVEHINDNLESIARKNANSLDKRFSYSVLRFDFNGVTNASAEVLRQVHVRRPGAGQRVQVFGVEVVLVHLDATSWTMTCDSDADYPTLTPVLPTGATNDERVAYLGAPIDVPAGGLTFTLSNVAASTITRGYVNLYLRCDRGSMGTPHDGYTPTLLNSLSSTAGAAIDAELEAAEDAVARDAANKIDLRATAVTVRSLAGTAAVVTLPAGTTKIHRVDAQMVCASGTDLDVSLTGGIDAIAFSVSGAGVTTRAVGGAGPGADPYPTNPMTLTLTRDGASTIDLAHVVVWFSSFDNFA